MNRTVSQEPPVMDYELMSDKRKTKDMYSIILGNSARDFSSECRKKDNSLDSRLNPAQQTKHLPFSELNRIDTSKGLILTDRENRSTGL